MRAFVFLVMLLICSEGVLAISLYPMNISEVSMYVGEEGEFPFSSRNDQTARELVFFAKASNDNVKVNGCGTEDDWNDDLDPYEMTVQSFELKAMKNGTSVVTYGVKTSPGSSSGVGFVESVVKQLTVSVRCDGDICVVVEGQSSCQSSSSGNSGSSSRSSGGGGGYVPPKAVVQTQPSITNTPVVSDGDSVSPPLPVTSDVVMSDVTPQQSGLSQMAVGFGEGPDISIGNAGGIPESVKTSISVLSGAAKVGLTGMIASSMVIIMLAMATLRLARTIELV